MRNDDDEEEEEGKIIDDLMENVPWGNIENGFRSLYILTKNFLYK